MPYSYLRALPVALVIVLLGGCGDNLPDGLPKLYPVTLHIKLDGQPLTDALVLLHTENEEIAKWTVGSYTDSEGNAILVTHGQFRGAPAGRFKVCVSKQGVPPEIQEQIDANRTSVVATAPTMGMAMPKSIEYVDPIFRSPDSTPLEIEVVPQGRKTVTFTLDVHKP